MPQHVALLGDSILDNSPYVAPERDTAGHLQHSLGSSWVVDLLARDGSTMADLRLQTSNLSSVTDVAVLSVGGNDAIQHIGLLEPRTTTTTELLHQLHQVAHTFGTQYRQILDSLLTRVGRLVVCTVYEPPLSDPVTARLARVPLTLLNDQIVRAALELGADVLDLRAICTEPSDFVQEIEPSPIGARKIAAAIDALVSSPGSKQVSRLFAV